METYTGGGRLPPPTPHVTGNSTTTAPTLATLEAALLAAYRALPATGGAALSDEEVARALALAALTVLQPARTPADHPDNLSVSALCRKEGLPVPLADATGDPETLVVRARYRKPSEENPYWRLTNTAGRTYRFIPGQAGPLERYQKGSDTWEEVPPKQESAAVKKVREAVDRAHAEALGDVLIPLA